MRIKSEVGEAVEITVIMIRMAKVDIFELFTQERDRPYSGDRLPRRLVIIEIAGKPIRRIVASDRGITDAGAEIESGQIVRQSRSRSSACANSENCQQGSRYPLHQRLQYQYCSFGPTAGARSSGQTAAPRCAVYSHHEDYASVDPSLPRRTGRRMWPERTFGASGYTEAQEGDVEPAHPNRACGNCTCPSCAWSNCAWSNRACSNRACSNRACSNRACSSCTCSNRACASRVRIAGGSRHAHN